MSLVLLSLIIVFALTISEYINNYTPKPYSSDLSTEQYKDFKLDLIIVSIILIFPIYAVTFTFIRSIYKLLKYNIKGFIKVCYIIAAGISFFTLVLFGLIITGILHLERILNYTNINATIFVIAGYPVNLFSFILGSLAVKSKAKKEVI